MKLTYLVKGLPESSAPPPRDRRDDLVVTGPTALTGLIDWLGIA